MAEPDAVAFHPYQASGERRRRVMRRVRTLRPQLLFRPGIYGGQRPSSACCRRSTYPVESSTPPRMFLIDGRFREGGVFTSFR